MSPFFTLGGCKRHLGCALFNDLNKPHHFCILFNFSYYIIKSSFHSIRKKQPDYISIT
ncbi:hypothetical protein MGAS15252_0497 [Streptococcus pyogenes MGAS15252]|nr:hypothetical protein M28_Spy0450 [Streptococcus pyogenes MGAS6180]ABF35534.1 hypothetical protein MGAS2096_Spy0482 [Streptococcus pyogenes MGAS2096]ABF37441.1 hypothetical protein MGAS10750_Spy0491 [Streptococcus pyogenes MGAS10750]AFC65848.1 hypothetical protein MGAS15252_0497 [Streptococcus pyogenes MGAS15252]AFC67717.1 hypothetical protein MGAS1882_0494 [Streptococcus pyogenes MGAS1882]BAC64552.1 hypothetical protein [Streptococcus pyogenes SSI-1]